MLFFNFCCSHSETSLFIKEKFRTKRYSEVGYYEIIFFIDGEWQIVFIDDLFPYDSKDNNFAFAKPKNKELYVALLEKAWAKINGGYTNIIAGRVNEPIAVLTGFPTSEITHSKTIIDDLFEQIEFADKDKTIISCGIYDEAKVERKGLVKGHAYTLLTAKAYKPKDIYLIKLRNPFGDDTEWTGDWSDNSRKWTPELKNYFKHESKTDGIFG